MSGFVKDGYDEGQKAGIAEGEKRVAAKMKEKGMDEKDIAEMTGLSVAEIRAL